MADPRILRVFPRKTAWVPDDDLVAIGEPGLFTPADIEAVHVSCAFTWDRAQCDWLQRLWAAHVTVPVLLGGPAVTTDPGDFVPGRYIKTGVTITSRGCPNKCPWCLVPKTEGALRELPISPGYIVQDNNLLATSMKHFEAVCAMLAEQPRAAIFSGGLEADRLGNRHVKILRGIRIKEVWTASDTPVVTTAFMEAVNRLRDFLPQRKIRAYVLIGRDDDTLAKAEKRLEAVWKAGALPFAQLYRPAGTGKWSDLRSEWRALARSWMRPAAIFAGHTKEDKS